MEYLYDSGVWYLISFLAFFIFLFGKLKAGITSALDDRIDGIKKQLEESEAMRVEAQELLAEYQRKYRDVVKEAEEIIEISKSNAESLKKQADKNLDEKLARQEEHLEERIRMVEAQAKAEIQQYAADLAIEGTRQIILENLSASAKKQLVEKSIKDIELTKH